MTREGFDEFPLAQGQDRSTHDTRHGGRIGNAEREDDAVLIGTEHREQSERQKDAGKGEKRVVDRHDHAIHPAAGITADEADQRAEERGEEHRQGADPDAGAGADHQAAQHVTAEFVGAEQVLGTRRGKARREGEFHRIEGRPDETDRGGDEQDRDENAADQPVESKLFHSATTRGSNRDRAGR